MTFGEISDLTKSGKALSRPCKSLNLWALSATPAPRRL